MLTDTADVTSILGDLICIELLGNSCSYVTSELANKNSAVPDQIKLFTSYHHQRYINITGNLTVHVYSRQG